MDIQEHRRQRLREWIADHGGHASVVREFKLTGSQASYLSQIVGGYSIAEKAARSWEDRLGMPHGNLDVLTARNHPPKQYPGAQPMSLSPFDDPPPTSWERILNMTSVPDTFSCEVPDDALAPHTPRGTPVVFVKGNEPPAPGTGVLVEDMHGQRYVRIFRPGVGGAWQAWARNENYPTLESKTHGLHILAVARNRMLDGAL